MDYAAEKSVAGIKSYKKYCVYANAPLDLTPSSEKFKLGNGVHDSLGKTKIIFPIGAQGNYLEFDTDVINTDTPILV